MSDLSVPESGATGLQAENPQQLFEQNLALFHKSIEPKVRQDTMEGYHIQSIGNYLTTDTSIASLQGTDGSLYETSVITMMPTETAEADTELVYILRKTPTGKDIQMLTYHKFTVNQDTREQLGINQMVDGKKIPLAQDQQKMVAQFLADYQSTTVDQAKTQEIKDRNLQRK